MLSPQLCPVFRTPPETEEEEEVRDEPSPEPESVEPEEKKRARLKSQTYITNLANNVTGASSFVLYLLVYVLIHSRYTRSGIL